MMEMSRLTICMNFFSLGFQNYSRNRHVRFSLQLNYPKKKKTLIRSLEMCVLFLHFHIFFIVLQLFFYSLCVRHFLRLRVHILLKNIEWYCLCVKLTKPNKTNYFYSLCKVLNEVQKSVCFFLNRKTLVAKKPKSITYDFYVYIERMETIIEHQRKLLLQLDVLLQTNQLAIGRTRLLKMLALNIFVVEHNLERGNKKNTLHTNAYNSIAKFCRYATISCI